MASCTKIKMECNEMIEEREKFARRNSLTAPAIANQQEEKDRRLQEMRLWDPLVRMNLDARGPSGHLDVNTTTSAAGDNVEEVDLSARLPKQFGMFTEMVYGVTVLVANVHCRQAPGANVPGLAWYYFRDRLFGTFEEQAQMRGLMRSKDSACANFMLIGGMAHTKSFANDGGTKAAGLVADAARRILEDAAVSNARHVMEERQRHHEAEDAEGEGADAAQQSKSFEISIRIGISSGNVAINVFGQRRPIYFGACGSETDTARSLSTMPPHDHDAAIMLSDSANALVSEAFFTLPRDLVVETGDKQRVVSGHLLTGKKDSVIHGDKIASRIGNRAAPVEGRSNSPRRLVARNSPFRQQGATILGANPGATRKMPVQLMQSLRGGSPRRVA
jgi:hypothetical protein